MKFIQLTKSELFSKKKQKSRFSWTLDESKYLNLEKVKRLRSSCRKAKELALKQNKYVPIRDWFMIEIGLNAGLRVEEMANLKCGDLLIAERQSSLIVQRGKGGRRRVIRINKEFKKICLWFLKWKKKNRQDTSEDAYLLTSSKGTQLTTRALQKAFKRCLARAGLEKHFSIHCLRHTFGSFLYKASKYNLRLVQKQLGHSSIRTTEVYASLIDPDAQEAAERLYK